MCERKGSARCKTKDQPSNNNDQCGYQGHYQGHSNFYINKLLPAPPVNNILPVRFVSVFVGNKHYHGERRNENKNGCQLIIDKSMQIRLIRK